MARKIALLILLAPSFAFAADGHVSGKIISLLGSANDPAIRIENLAVPAKCDGGAHGWLYFSGTAQERQWVYSTAMAMAVTGNTVTVYTNTDYGRCRIHNIQVTSGLN